MRCSRVSAASAPGRSALNTSWPTLRNANAWGGHARARGRLLWSSRVSRRGGQRTRSTARACARCNVHALRPAPAAAHALHHRAPGGARPFVVLGEPLEQVDGGRVVVQVGRGDGCVGRRVLLMGDVRPRVLRVQELVLERPVCAAGRLGNGRRRPIRSIAVVTACYDVTEQRNVAGTLEAKPDGSPSALQS